MYNEDSYIALSALEHYLYCPRQCALIHLEQIWVENVHTAEGKVLHESVDKKKMESRGDIKYATSLLMSSARLGISGKADMVEFYKKDNYWLPYPVEYKKGSKVTIANKVQLCAQAMCLEEMLNIEVPEGALFLGKNRRRSPIFFDEYLRKKVEEVALAIHNLFYTEQTPPASYSKLCDECSLMEICLPKISTQKVDNYLKHMLN